MNKEDKISILKLAVDQIREQQGEIRVNQEG